MVLAETGRLVIDKRAPDRSPGAHRTPPDIRPARPDRASTRSRTRATSQSRSRPRPSSALAAARPAASRKWTMRQLQHDAAEKVRARRLAPQRDHAYPPDVLVPGGVPRLRGARPGAWPPHPQGRQARRASTLGLGVVLVYCALMALSESLGEEPPETPRAPGQTARRMGPLGAQHRPRPRRRHACCGGAAARRAAAVALPVPRFSDARRKPAGDEAPRPAAARPVVVLRVPRLRSRAADPRPLRQRTYYLRTSALALHRAASRSITSARSSTCPRSCSRARPDFRMFLAATSGTRRRSSSSHDLPVAILVAVLGTIGGLTRTGELMVMRACGISLYRVALPLLLLASSGAASCSCSTTACWRRRTGGPRR